MGTISYTPKSVVLDPVSRVEGHLKVEVTVDQNAVTDARITGTMFRGIEKILANRTPLDAPDITQRICGVCPVSHALAASETLENAAGFTPPANARIMRNLVLGANFLQSHVLHFYVLSALDYVDGPAMPPWQPSWSGGKRLKGDTATKLVNNYVAALDIRRKCHEMGAIFGGRLPHPPTFVPGGFTTTPRKERIDLFKKYLAEVSTFIRDVYIPDVNLVGSVYSDYLKVGAGYGNLLAYGVFDQNDSGTDKLLKRGASYRGSAPVPTVDTKAITERVTFSWYASQSDNRNPTSGDTTPQFPKTDAYSWLKAPRYNSEPCEVGPLARMWVNGDYQHGISVMDRHLSRAEEASKVAAAMANWVGELNPTAPVYRQYSVPVSGSGVGLTEAPRGALGHWINISGGMTANYQIITPTCWNASPMDERKQCGPIEKALIGTPVDNINEPIEVVRVIHSFDPCLSCAVHVMRTSGEARVFTLAF